MNAKLNIAVAERNGSSFLKNSFFTTPFKIADITEDKSSGKLELMLMSSSPGILDKDEYDIMITIAANCSLQLHTQGYQRLFNMNTGATQKFEACLADGASFFYLPHPSVPHEDSDFTSHNKFYLGNNCSLIYAEILTCGRKLSGEKFLFSKYHSISSFYINKKLVIKENLLMQPSVVNVHAIGQLEGYTHQASLVWLQEEVNLKEIQSVLASLLAKEKDSSFGISVAPVSGLIIRILGYGAEQLYNCLQDVSSTLQKLAVKKPFINFFDTNPSMQ